MTDPFIRQRVLAGFGARGQDALAGARVAIVGVGGLGCPAALYLAASGVGRITLVDADSVTTSNLHRQVLYGPGDVGHLKVQAAATALARIAPWCDIEPMAERVTAENAVAALSGHDVIVDGTDTFPSRMVMADVANELHVPLVWGAVQGWYGQVTVFDGSVGLRDVFPSEPPPDFGVCDAGGVLGALCGQVGTAMATEAIKVLTGVGTPLVGTLAVIDAREGRWRDLPVGRAPVESE
jgi:molybdopterin/thiamine biosynthesis adenylyltransferase